MFTIKLQKEEIQLGLNTWKKMFHFLSRPNFFEWLEEMGLKAHLTSKSSVEIEECILRFCYNYSLSNRLENKQVNK